MTNSCFRTVTLVVENESGGESSEGGSGVVL